MDSSKNSSFSKGQSKPEDISSEKMRVEKFQIPNLDNASRPTYQSIKDRFKREGGLQHGANNFILSELVHSQLSVEAEEERRLNDRVRKEIERVQAEARDNAYAEGLAKGEAEGRRRAYEEEKARLAVLLEGMASLLQSMTDAKNKLADQYETELVDQAFNMAKIIVENEIEERPEAVAHTVRAILEKISRDDDVRIRLSSADFEVVQKVEKEISGISRSGRITFDMDASIKPGDCIVESVSGEIVSFVEDKMKKLKQEIKRIYPNVGEKTGT